MATIPGLSTLASPASSALLWIYDPAATPSDRSHSIASLAARVKRLNREFRVDASGGEIGLTAFETENLILTSSDPSVVTLPQASTCVGYKVRIIAAYAGAALVTITPYTDDHIELQAANVSIFLNNSDASANISKFQYVDLIAVASGYWAVIGGNYCPDQAVDTDGSHACLGRLHLLPQDATSRVAFNDAPPAQGAASSAIQVTGLYGVPASAKAVLANVLISAYSAAAGAVAILLGFSDNNTYSVNGQEASAYVGISTYESASARTPGVAENVVISLNSLGRFYIWGGVETNVTLASCDVVISIRGYYMGD